MKKINQLKKKAQDLTKKVKLLEERYLLAENLLNEIPVERQNFILKVWNKDSWDEDFLIGPKFDSLQNLVQNYKIHTEQYKTEFQSQVEQNSELKELLVQKNLINKTHYCDSDIKSISDEINNYHENKKTLQTQMLKDKQIQDKYAQAKKIALSDKLDLLSFVNEKEAREFFKDNYNDYVEADYDGYGQETVYMYIDDSLVKVNYEVEFLSHRDHNDCKYYAPERLISCSFDLFDQDILNHQIEQAKNEEIKALEDKLKNLKSS